MKSTHTKPSTQGGKKQVKDIKKKNEEKLTWRRRNKRFWHSGFEAAGEESGDGGKRDGLIGMRAERRSVSGVGCWRMKVIGLLEPWQQQKKSLREKIQKDKDGEDKYISI